MRQTILNKQLISGAVNAKSFNIFFYNNSYLVLKILTYRAQQIEDVKHNQDAEGCQSCTGREGQDLVDRPRQVHSVVQQTSRQGLEEGADHSSTKLLNLSCHGRRPTGHEGQRQGIKHQ